MQKLLFSALSAGALALMAVTSANAFVPVGSQVDKASAGLSDTIQVKRSKAKSRPPGWDNPRGNKTGWGARTPGKTLPPGQR